MGFSDTNPDRSCKLREKAEREGNVDIAFACRGGNAALSHKVKFLSKIEILDRNQKFCLKSKF